MSLRVRMALAAGVAVAVAVIAVSIAAYAGTSTQVHGQLDQSLRSLAGRIAPASGGGPPGGAGGKEGDRGGGPSPGQLKEPDEGLHLDADNGTPFGGAAGTVALVHANGSVFQPPAQKGTVPVGPRAKALAATGRGEYFQNMTVHKTDIRVLAKGIGPYGALLVALPMGEVDHTLDRLLGLLGLIAAGGILFAAALGLLVARTALGPIGRFTRQTEAIAANPERLESERVDVHGRDELARLARTFNQTLDALARSVRSQRNLVADASHELRTPIATIRANLQLMRDEARLSDEDREALRRDVIEELDELTALVGDVVELARGSSPTGDQGDVRVDELVAAAVERFRRRSPDLPIEATVEPTLVYGEADRISRAVANLLDNAAKYGRNGAGVEVTLADGTLTVRDHGPGFKEADLPFVFDRFHRSGDARSQPGSGLGLAIVRQAAEAHGGFAEASNAEGGGALLRVGFGPALEVEEAETDEAVSEP